MRTLRQNYQSGVIQSIDYEEYIVHDVYLKLKQNLADSIKNSFLGDLQQLDKIPFIKQIRIGTFIDTEDPRQYKDYDIVLSVTLHNLHALEDYQNHPLHISLRNKYKDIFARSPLVFDSYFEQH